MALNLRGPRNSEGYLKTQMQGIPHFIDLDIPGLTQERLLGLLENLKEEVDEDDVCREETVFKLNFKSWVYIKLGDRVKAEEINDSVIALTRWENVMAVGNCVFLSLRSGRQEKVSNCLSRLQEMKRLPNFQKRFDTAKAELAYCYSRVGGPENLFKAIRLFEEVVDRNADTLYWKLRLGLAYRRCTHLNIYTGMPDGRTIIECVENAAKYLTNVCRDSSAGKLRGPALSELAVLCKAARFIIQRNDMDRIFGKQTPEQMCNEALKYEANSTWVLTNCGKMFRSLKNINKAVAVLEECLRVRKHTTTHHQLGLCYAWMAEKESKPQTHGREQEAGRQVSRGRGGLSSHGRGGQSYPGRGQAYPGRGQAYTGRGAQSGYVRQRDYRYPSASAPVITLPNENYNRAEREYLEAIKLSHDRNLPAMYDLGLLYILAGKYQDALDRFNQVTNSKGEGNLVTLINAYEQAGICYMQMGNPEAEDKLTKAISLAVKVASTCPQLQNCATEMWQSFRTMRDMLEGESPSPSRDRKLIRLNELVKNHKGVVKVVEEILALSDSKLEDPEIITAGLRGYLQLRETEKAFVLLNMVSMGSNMTNTWGTPEMMELRRAVLLRTAENRLKLHSTDAKYVFQELFKLQYGQCAGGVSEDSVDIPNNRDVLLFYDDDHDTEELSQISKIVRDMQTVLSHVFGLDVSMNLQGCLTYGPKMAEQLEEMRKYQVVVVVLGEETRNAEFRGMMKMIPHMTTTIDPSKKVVVIDACQQATEIPEILRHCPCFRLRHQAVGNWGQREVGAARREGHRSVKNFIQHIVGGDLMCLMPLFQFVVGLY